MIRKFIACALALFSAAAFATTTMPPSLISTTGSTFGQAIVSTGPTTAAAWTSIVDSVNAGSGVAVSGATGNVTVSVATNGVALSQLAQQAANTVLTNATGSTANVTAFSMPSCSTSASALDWTSGSGFTCNTAVNAAQLGGATFAAPGSIGGTTPATGAFTTLNASGNDALFYQTTNALSVPNAAATTVTTWTKVSDRVNANFNAATGVFTAPVAGQYRASAGLTFGTTTGGTTVAMSVRIVGNGVTLCQAQTPVATTTTTSQTVVTGCTISLSASQTIVVQAFQNSGSSVVLATGNAYNNYLSIERIP